MPFLRCEAVASGLKRSTLTNCRHSGDVLRSELLLDRGDSEVNQSTSPLKYLTARTIAVEESVTGG